MNKNDENWYLRSLHNIADSVGQVKVKRYDSMKKMIDESFDIKIDANQSKKIIAMLDKKVDEEFKISFIEDELSSILSSVDEITLKKISSYLYNYKN